MFDQDSSGSYPQEKIKWTRPDVWQYIDVLSPMIYAGDDSAIYPGTSDMQGAIDLIHNGGDKFDAPPMGWSGKIMPSVSLQSQSSDTYKIMKDNGLGDVLMYASGCKGSGPLTSRNYCGTDYADAENRCNGGMGLQCKDGTDANCPTCTTCFGEVALCPFNT